MRKLTGALCVLLGGALALWTGLSERNRRRAVLEDLRRGLYRLGEEVRLSRMPLPALLGILASDCGEDAAAFFRTVSACLRRGTGLEEAWQEAAASLPLPPPDTSLPSCRSILTL